MIASTPLRSATWSGKKTVRAVSALGKGKAEIEKGGTPTIRDGTRRVASQTRLAGHRATLSSLRVFASTSHRRV